MEWLKIPAARDRKRNKITKSPFYFFVMEKKAEWNGNKKESENQKIQ